MNIGIDILTATIEQRFGIECKESKISYCLNILNLQARQLQPFLDSLIFNFLDHIQKSSCSSRVFSLFEVGSEVTEWRKISKLLNSNVFTEEAPLQQSIWLIKSKRRWGFITGELRGGGHENRSLCGIWKLWVNEDIVYPIPSQHRQHSRLSTRIYW